MAENGTFNFSTEAHRQRLLSGMARCIAEQGYAETTIADVASMSHVSKRTFYEHFRSKQDCLLALYVHAGELAMARMKEAILAEQDAAKALESGIRAFFSHLASHPEHLRTLFVEITHLGHDGLQARKNMRTNMMAVMRETGLNIIDTAHGRIGLVGVIAELVLSSLENDCVADLPGLAPQATTLIKALVNANAREESLAT